jgi:hypothetical protein
MRHQGKVNRTWIPVEDASGAPSLVIEEFNTLECRPIDPVVGLLTRDNGMLGAGLPARGNMFRMSGLPILVPGRLGSVAGGSLLSRSSASSTSPSFHRVRHVISLPTKDCSRSSTTSASSPGA